MYPEPASPFPLTPLNTRIFSSQSKRNFGLEGCYAGFGYGVILFAGSSADADAPDDFANFLQGNACEDSGLFQPARQI
jgi:hypothetical protein